MRKIFIVIFCFVFSLACSFGQGFSEMAESFGIDYDFKTDEYGGGVSFVDFDQDGLDDLTFATGPSEQIRFHKNTGDGFVEIAALVDNTTETKQIFWIDFNNDKLLDLYVTSSDQNKLYKNTGELKFEDVTEEMGLPSIDQLTFAAHWLDYDQDGWLDLFVTYRTVDEEGWIDLYRNVNGDSFDLMTNKSGLNGKGNSVLTMTSFDYNNDGWTDIFLAQDWEQGNQLLHNNGNGTFSDVSLISNTNQKMNSMTATAADFNEDGWLDIYVTNTREGTVLLENNGDGTFTDVAEVKGLQIRSLTFGAIFFDADNDSDLDLHIVGGQVNYMYENMGNDEPYRRVNEEWGFEKDRFFNNGFSIGDYNGDGYVDLVKNSMTLTGTVTGVNTFWENNFRENGYLSVDLEGTVSNSFGIGSKIKLYLGDRVLVRRVASGESFCSQLSYTQFFGIGDHEVIDKVVVEWPSGNTSEILDVATNQKLSVTEPYFGCSDVNACNYSPGAMADDKLCRYTETYFDCSGCLNDLDQDGVCDELEVLGCTDVASCSFNPNATESDGSCTYLQTHVIEGEKVIEAMVAVPYSYADNLGSSYEWEAVNGSVIIGQGSANIQVIWHAAKEGTLSVTETNVENCKSETVSIEVEGIVLGGDKLGSQVYQIYPNPAKDFFTVQMANTVSSLVTLFDLNGQLMLKERVENLSNQSIDVSFLEAGLYMVLIENSGKVHPIKLLVGK